MDCRNPARERRRKGEERRKQHSAYFESKQNLNCLLTKNGQVYIQYQQGQQSKNKRNIKRL
jgi:hypothetical protein